MDDNETVRPGIPLEQLLAILKQIDVRDPDVVLFDDHAAAFARPDGVRQLIRSVEGRPEWCTAFAAFAASGAAASVAPLQAATDAAAPPSKRAKVAHMDSVR